jgi:hypothetical protein
MSEDRSVEEIAHEVLMRQAKARAERTEESIEEAMEVVLNTEAGAQLRDVPHDEESIEEWRAWHESGQSSGRKISAIILRSTRSTPRTAEEPNSAEPIPRRGGEAERERDELRRQLHALRHPQGSPDTAEEQQGRGVRPTPPQQRLRRA